MKRFLIPLAILMAATVSAAANLGDSSDNIERADGALVERHLRDDGRVSAVYYERGSRYRHFVVYDRGVSVLERITRIDRREFSKKEIDRILKANAAGGKWSPVSNRPERKFERSDHKAEATCDKVDDKPTLTLWKK